MSRMDAGRYTDEQFYELHVRPAVKRKRRRERKRAANRLPTKEEYVLAGVQLGGNREQLEAGYDRWKATQGGGNGDAD